ncbi:MAG: hypothetical protein KC420_02950 [Myxococcales bacterium]|nr:hypothetical protein [Myxococcales bacterium]
MKWQEIKPKTTRRRAGRLKPSGVWSSTTGYQVARVDLKVPGSGWAVWAMTPTGWRRLFADVHLNDAADAMSIAALEYRRRMVIAVLPRPALRLAELVRRAVARMPVDRAVDAMIAARPDGARTSRLLGEYLKAVIRGD